MAKEDCHRRVQDNPGHQRLSRSPSAIGVFDSGIGGLSVLKALQAELPQENFIYVADSGHGPYGERDHDYVVERSRRITDWFVAQNVKALVVACNTATAAAIHQLRAEMPQLPIIGVEPALKPAVALSRTGRIGVMATRGTLASEKFKVLLESQAGLATFVLQACDGLADAIERSVLTGDDTETLALCTRYTSAMGKFGDQAVELDTLVLGCTHYPFAEEHLRKLVGPKVELISTGEAVARQTRRQLTALTRLDESDGAGTAPRLKTGGIRLFSTGDPHRLQTAAQTWLGLAGSAQLLNI